MADDKPRGDTPDLSDEEDAILDKVWDKIAKEEAAKKEKEGKNK